VTELSATAYTAMVDRGEIHIRKLCMHCVDPTCVSVCPVGALQKTSEGPVVYDSNKCMGCRYCMLACPFNVPRYEWNQVVPSVRKCDLCIDRQRNGEMPACAEVCPVEATISGSRSEILAEAHRRMADAPADYHPHVFGESEIGGTSVMFLSPVPFESLGFPIHLGEDPLPRLTAEALGRIPGIVLVGGTALLAIHWITKRREFVARVEGTAGLLPATSGNPGDGEDDHESN